MKFLRAKLFRFRPQPDQAKYFRWSFTNRSKRFGGKLWKSIPGQFLWERVCIAKFLHMFTPMIFTLWSTSERRLVLTFKAQEQCSIRLRASEVWPDLDDLTWTWINTGQFGSTWSECESQFLISGLTRTWPDPEILEKCQIRFS